MSHSLTSHSGRIVLSALLLSLGLAACDSAEQPVSDPATPAQPGATGAVSHEITVVYTSEARALRSFETAEAFEDAVTAVETLARTDGQPIIVHENLRTYADYSRFAPPGELTFYDALGRVVVAGNMYTLQRDGDGVRSVVTTVVGNRSVEVIVPVGAADPNSPTGNPDVAARIQSWDEDAFGRSNAIRVRPSASYEFDMWYVTANSAFTTGTNRKRASAQTEVVVSVAGGNFEGAREATTGDLPGLSVYAQVYSEYFGCKQSSASSPSTGRIYAYAEVVRGTGQAVSFSNHASDIQSPFAFGAPSLRFTTDAITGVSLTRLDGEDDDNPINC